MNFYKHHIGDYDQATRHLSFVEDAAYSRLIRKYYAEEKVFPADVKKIERLIGARTKEEREAVSTVLDEFFVLEADGWHNKRCDEELAKANAQAEINRKIALAREAKKREQLEHAQSTNRAATDSTNRDGKEHESWPDANAENGATSNQQKTFSEKFPSYDAKSNPANPRQMGNVEHESLQSREPSQTPDSRLQTPDLKPSSVVVAGGQPTRGGSDDFTPRNEGEWLRHLRAKHGFEADPTDVNDRKRYWQVFARWINAGIKASQIDAAIAKAHADSSEPISNLISYADRVLVSMNAPPRMSATDARSESRRRAYEVLTGKTPADQSEVQPAEVINGHIKLIG